MNKKNPNKQEKKPPKPTNQQTNQPKKTKKTQLDFFTEGWKKSLSNGLKLKKIYVKNWKGKLKRSILSFSYF